MAAAVKLTVVPASTDWLAGLIVTAGGASTESLAAVVVVVPRLLVNTARYCVPEAEVVAVKE